MMTWKEILSFEQFTDATVYFFMAAMGTVLFSIRLVMMMAFGLDDAGGDFDVDADGAMDIHDSGFGLFSMISILAFMMGAGWVGVACRTTMDLGPIATAMASSGFGFALMFGSAFGMYQMKKFNASGKYDVNTCVGNLGQVYLRIPKKGEGRGEVQISIAGRSMMVKAVSAGDEIESFVTVKVLEIQQGSNTLIVEKHT